MNWICYVERGSFLFRAIQNHRQNRYNMRLGGLLLCNATSDRLETGWVTHWGSGLLIWIETGLCKQGVSFIELSKITGRTGRIWDLEGFYCVMQHQIVLKLAEWHTGVVDCQSELKLVCWNRDFYFYNYVNLQINVFICKFIKGFYFVISHQTVIFILFGNSTFNITQHLKSFSFYQTVF